MEIMGFWKLVPSNKGERTLYFAGSYRGIMRDLPKFVDLKTSGVVNMVEVPIEEVASASPDDVRERGILADAQESMRDRGCDSYYLFSV